MAEILTFQRHSIDQILDDIARMGPESRGVINIILRRDGEGHFRISGFMSKTDLFAVLGLLDWVKADLLSDILLASKPIEE